MPLSLAGTRAGSNAGCGATTAEELAEWGRLDESFRNVLHARGIECNFGDEQLAPRAPFTIDTELVSSVTTESKGNLSACFCDIARQLANYLQDRSTGYSCTSAFSASAREC